MDVDSNPKTDAGRKFKFTAFSFDTANVDDSIEIVSFFEIGDQGSEGRPVSWDGSRPYRSSEIILIFQTCSIKLGKTGDDYSDSGDTCDGSLTRATVQ